jgi:uncharacterized oxidoreductase
MNMDLDRACVMITGGSEGIGRGLAARFAAAGSRVLVSGRSAEKLARAARDIPGLETIVSDIGKPEDRERLADHIGTHMPELNIVINNAGLQRRIALAADSAPWFERQAEIDTLLSGPIHLSNLLVPLILAHGAAAIIANVTSGGAYVPQPFAPIYSACKAALHSYTVNLRHALSQSACRVVEIIPPAVQTALAGPAATHGVPLDAFCDAVFTALSSGDTDNIGYGMTATAAFDDAKQPYAAMFEAMSRRFDVTLY